VLDDGYDLKIEFSPEANVSKVEIPILLNVLITNKKDFTFTITSVQPKQIVVNVKASSNIKD